MYTVDLIKPLEIRHILIINAPAVVISVFSRMAVTYMNAINEQQMRDKGEGGDRENDRTMKQPRITYIFVY